MGLAILALLVAGPIPTQLRAQAVDSGPVAEASGPAPRSSFTEATGPPTDGALSSDAEAEPKDPRAGYNRALARLEAGELEAAARGFEATRTGAGTDGEVRFRATYNLGWVEVARAEAALDQEPRAALQALQRAADWFREAIALRPEHEASRRNLELALRRALVLADHLAQGEGEDLATRLEGLIEAQRTLLTALGRGVDLAALQDDPDAAEPARRALRAFAGDQLAVLTQAERLSETAGREQAGLQAKSDEARGTEEALRLARLEPLLKHLHRARERMGQARSQLRRLAARRAYRRVAAALGDLKRARDQLLDPVARLDALIADGLALMRQTGHKAALAVRPEQEAPRWLTAEHLSETQGVLEARTGELHAGLSAGLAQAEAIPAAEEPTRAPEPARLRRRLETATPLIGAARQAFQEALAALRAGRIGAALVPQRTGVAKLAAAREHFLDLERLVELLYREEQRIAALLAPGVKKPAADAVPDGNGALPEAQATGGRSEALPIAHKLQAGNRKRLQRVSAAILDRLGAALDAEERAKGAPTAQPDATAANPQAPDPPDPAALEAERRRLEQADALRVEVEKAMQQALKDLEVASALPTDDEGLTGLIDQAQDSVERTLSRIEALRRLFFSVVDHLRETLRRQVDLGDRTEEVSGLAATEPAAETARRLGPIGSEQTALAETAGSIAEALAQQAERPAPAAPTAQGNTQAQPAAADQEQPARLREAADQVTGARDRMEQAAATMAGEPPPFETIRDHQRQAVEALAAALAALQPPQQPGDSDQPPPKQQDQAEQQESGSNGQDQSGPEPQPQPGDSSQLLQGVRDREARRRESRARQQFPGYEPVEKDW
ncbi:MAG: hypothetical protein LGR52_02415 [Candidatus Thiosymbion ectosymbiont of Robbea hypermnestra]|nr:hypothetical protein [Candidatus Thiosymbion ectosymbiont of Robbea hypermnestra]